MVGGVRGVLLAVALAAIAIAIASATASGQAGAGTPSVKQFVVYGVYTKEQRSQLVAEGYDIGEAAWADHVELFGRPRDPSAHSRNFVLCPGKAYDRSPCGTGTSSKLACLFADGQLTEGEVWRQGSIVRRAFGVSVRGV